MKAIIQLVSTAIYLVDDRPRLVVLRGVILSAIGPHDDVPDPRLLPGGGRVRRVVYGKTRKEAAEQLAELG